MTREHQRGVTVTIYNGNLGLVKDTRETRLPVGIADIEFRDVAALIDPATVHLRSLTAPDRLRILEQNYEYDLLSSEKLMENLQGIDGEGALPRVRAVVMSKAAAQDAVQRATAPGRRAASASPNRAPILGAHAHPSGTGVAPVTRHAGVEELNMPWRMTRVLTIVLTACSMPASTAESGPAEAARPSTATVEAPTDVTVLRFRPDLVLRFRHAGTGVTRFEVERATDSGDFVRIGTVPREARTFRDRTAASAHTYAYRVRAFTAGTASGYSSEVLVTLTPARGAGPR